MQDNNNSSLYGEVRVRFAKKETQYAELINVASHQGITVNRLIKKHLKDLLAQYPDHQRSTYKQKT